MIKTMAPLLRKSLSIILTIALLFGLLGTAVIFHLGANNKTIQAAGDTWVVTSNADSGTGSLRAAIDGANDGDTIVFDLTDTTITLSSTIGFNIPNLTIDGGAGVTIKRDAANSSEFGLLYSGTATDTLTLKNLTLTNGKANNGGGLYAWYDVILENCIFTNNTATNGGGGGVYASGTVTLTNCTFTGNTASGDGGGVRAGGSAILADCIFTNNTATNGGGGGVYASGSATLTNSNFIGNTASSYGGGVRAGGSAILADCIFTNNTATNGGGGGLYAFGTATLSNCIFTGNLSGLDGGGVYAGGTITLANSAFANNTSGSGTVFSRYGSVTGTNSTFFSNTVNPTSGLFAGIVRAETDVSLYHCTFTNNQNNGVGSAYNAYVYNSGTSTITLANCLMTQDGLTGNTNKTIEDGYDNMRAGNGSDDESDSDDYESWFDNNVLTFNYVMPLPGVAGGASVLSGYTTDAAGNNRGAVDSPCLFGAINWTAMSWMVTTSLDPAATSPDTTLRSCVDEAEAYNTSPLPDKRVVYFAPEKTNGGVPDFYITLSGTQISFSKDIMIIGRLGANGLPEITVDANEASRVFNHTGTGASHFYGLTITKGKVTSADGGGIYSNGSLVIQDCVISENTVINGHGGGIYVNGAFTMYSGTISNNNAGYGGGGVSNDGTFTMYNGTILNNSAMLYGSGIYNNGIFTMYAGTISNNNTNFGGGIYNNGTFTMENGTISNNNAVLGGGLENFGGTFSMNGGMISGNYAIYGGGVCVYEGTFTMTGGMISNNEAEDNGGGVYNYGTFTMTGGTISNNNTGYGGGIYNNDTFTMENGTISNNNAGYGGGIYNNGAFIMNGGAISYNEAENDGGGVYNNNDSTFAMNNGTISHNVSWYDGGGVENNGTFTLNDGRISDNYADNSGGGVYNYIETFTMNGGTISNNEAQYNGGGVFNSNDRTFTMNAGEISYNTAGDGGGVSNYGTFTMTGGMISNNEAQLNGGGVYNYATFTFSAISNDLADIGIIAANTADYGGGVYNEIGGTFTMKGGFIGDTDEDDRTNGNIANYDGGGVYNEGTFIMEWDDDVDGAGIISCNKASNNGGGVYNEGTMKGKAGGLLLNEAVNGGGVYNDGSLEIIRGTQEQMPYMVAGNIATANGGGVYNSGDGTLEITAAMIAFNTAVNGGGVYTVSYDDFSTANDPDSGESYVVFGGNEATGGYKILVTGSAIYNIYAQQIRHDTPSPFNMWSINPGASTPGTPFDYGYNNYDINFKPFSVTVNGSYATPSGSSQYIEGMLVNVHAGTRSGYTFDGWQVVSGGVILDDSTSTSTFFTMPAEDVSVTATWKADTQPPTTSITTTTSTTPPGNTGGPSVIPTTISPSTTTTTIVTTPTTATTTITTTTPITSPTTTTSTTTTTTPTPTTTTSTTTTTPPSTTATTPTTQTAVPTTAPTTSSAIPPVVGDDGDTWALTNLILAIIGAVMALIAALKSIIRSGNEGIWSTKLLWLLIVVALGIIGLVIFFLTQDMTNPATFVDLWTITHVALLALGALFTFLGLKQGKQA